MIDVGHLSVTKGGKTIVSDVSLSVREGEKLLLRGPSGCGKSTLLRALLFFEPFRGSIRFRNETVDRTNLAAFRSRISFLGQTLPQFQVSADELLQMPFRYRANRDHRPDEAEKQRLLEALNFNGGILETSFADLSGGERQRLLILQVLLLNKPVAVFDEITSALDRKNIAGAVREITADPRRTVIAVSHQAEWEAAADRVIEMEEGRVLEGTG